MTKRSRQIAHKFQQGHLEGKANGERVFQSFAGATCSTSFDKGQGMPYDTKRSQRFFWHARTSCRLDNATGILDSMGSVVATTFHENVGDSPCKEKT
jgi:hypothetical protein